MQEDKSTDVVASAPDMLQHLVSEAVKKVLAAQVVTDTEKVSQNIVSQVVEGLKPTLSSGSATTIRNVTPNIGKHIAIPTPITKPVACVYNPTPIAELKKRHIPVVSYMPTRESRVAVKRKFSPERTTPWSSIIQESSSSQVMPEVTYKPTAIVNTVQDEQSYVPTLKLDTSSSNSYDDNSNDYQPKFKEEYYPRSKKRREEYVPKKIKAPLKTVQQLNAATLNRYESEFDMIDEIITSNHATSVALGQAKASASEDSQDYSLDIESRFSDDEPVEDVSTDEHSVSVKKSEQTEDVNEKEKENLQHAGIDTSDKQSNKDNKMHSNHYDVKTGDIKSSDRFQQHKASDSRKLSERREDAVKQDTDKEKEKHKNRDKSKEKDRKENRHSSEKRDKERSKHKTDSKDRHRSSSSRDKDKRRSSRDSKDSSHGSREYSDSRRHRHTSPKKDRNDHHKSSRHNKHKSTSNSSKSSRHTSSRSDRKHRSESNRRSSDSSRKSSKHKESSSERNSSDRSDSSVDSIHSFVDNEILELSDSDHDVQEECLRIFQEYQASDYPKLVSVKKSLKDETESVEDVGKKRVAHPSAATSVTRQIGPSQPPKKFITPQQKMYERWRLMREAAAAKAAEKAAKKVAEKAAANTKTQVTCTSADQSLSNVTQRVSVHKDHIESASSISNSDMLPNTNGRIRIAHVPYAKSLAMEKQKVIVTAGKSGDAKGVDNKTIAQTTKGGVRVAHIPQVVPQLVRPEPLQVATQKFPLNVRQYYINLMHDICVQIYTNGDDAAQRAVKEELACHERCKALAVYKNSCMLAAHRLRKEIDQSKSNETFASSSCDMMSHEAILVGKSKGSWSVVKSKKIVTDFKGPALYNMLKKWIMSEQQLRDNGFPRKHPDNIKGQAKVYVINARNQTVLSKVPNERMCSRCGQAYMIDKQGFAVLQQNCIYHWGRKFTIRGEGKYSCCQQYGSATGCCDAKTHVWDYTDYENLRGYVKTFPKDVPIDEQGVYALDCEMCYTTQGLELTSVIFYTVMFLENSLLIGVWIAGVNRADLLPHQHHLHPVTLVLILLALFFGGMFFMGLYYRFFHVRRLRYEAGGRMTGSNLTTLSNQDNTEEKQIDYNEGKKVNISIGMRKVKLSNGGIPGVFNCRFANPTVVNPNRKKKKPTSFVPPPPPQSQTSTVMNSVAAIGDSKQWLHMGNGSRQLIPFWKKPISSNIIQNDSNERKDETDMAIGGSLNVTLIREKLKEKKQQQLRELRAIQEEIKEGKLFPPPSASTSSFSSSPSASNQQPPPNTKLHTSPSSPLFTSPPSFSEQNGGSALSSWPPVKMHCLLPPPPSSPYYPNSHPSNPWRPAPQRERADTPEILLAPRCLPHHYPHWSPLGHPNHRLHANQNGVEESSKDKGDGETEISDMEGSQVSLPRSYTLPREFKYNPNNAVRERERRAGNKIFSSRFYLPSTNSSDGDVDSADNEDETDSEAQMQTKAHHGHNYDEILQRRHIYENNEENDAAGPNIECGASNNCYLNNSHAVLRPSQLLRTRVKHETKL